MTLVHWMNFNQSNHLGQFFHVIWFDLIKIKIKNDVQKVKSIFFTRYLILRKYFIELVCDVMRKLSFKIAKISQGKQSNFPNCKPCFAFAHLTLVYWCRDEVKLRSRSSDYARNSITIKPNTLHKHISIPVRNHKNIRYGNQRHRLLLCHALPANAELPWD